MPRSLEEFAESLFEDAYGDEFEEWDDIEYFDYYFDFMEEFYAEYDDAYDEEAV